MDLHRLCKTHGEDKVAELMGLSVGSMRNKRAGARPITIDEFYRLGRYFGTGPDGFSIVATVARIGAKREQRAGVSREVAP